MAVGTGETGSTAIRVHEVRNQSHRRPEGADRRGPADRIHQGPSGLGLRLRGEHSRWTRRGQVRHLGHLRSVRPGGSDGHAPGRLGEERADGQGGPEWLQARCGPTPHGHRPDRDLRSRAVGLRSDGLRIFDGQPAVGGQRRCHRSGRRAPFDRRGSEHGDPGQRGAAGGEGFRHSDGAHGRRCRRAGTALVDAGGDHQPHVAMARSGLQSVGHGHHDECRGRGHRGPRGGQIQRQHPGPEGRRGPAPQGAVPDRGHRSHGCGHRSRSVWWPSGGWPDRWHRPHRHRRPDDRRGCPGRHHGGRSRVLHRNPGWILDARRRRSLPPVRAERSRTARIVGDRQGSGGHSDRPDHDHGPGHQRLRWWRGVLRQAAGDHPRRGSPEPEPERQGSAGCQHLVGHGAASGGGSVPEDEGPAGGWRSVGRLLGPHGDLRRWQDLQQLHPDRCVQWRCGDSSEHRRQVPRDRYAEHHGPERGGAPLWQFVADRQG